MITMEGIIAAIITGVLALVGVIISNTSSNRRVEASLEKAQAVTDTKIDELTRQVHLHNGVIERTYKLEGQMTEVQHDIRDLKSYHKPTHTN